MTYFERKPVSPGSAEFSERALQPGDQVVFEYFRGTSNPKLALVVEHPLTPHHALQIERAQLIKYPDRSSSTGTVIKDYYRGEINLSRRKTPDGASVVWKPSPKR